MPASEYLHNCRSIVWKGTYSGFEVHTFPPDFVAALRDLREKRSSLIFIKIHNGCRLKQLFS